MAPAQPLGIDGEDGKPKVVVKLEETDGDVDEKKEKNELGLVCASNFEDSAFYGDSRDRLEGNALDQEVDVVGSGDGEVAELEKSEDPDATEQSSSFGNTFSGSEDEVKISTSDMEVDSQFSTENATEIGEQPVPDELGRLLKKKKVTAHWRRFISPLMWRCQWLELRMNELRSQASLYDKELAAYKREKQLQSKMIELDDSVSRSVPLTCKNHKKRAMKRMKRKRIEDTVDITSYMSNHNIFSYYENKRSETDCHSVDNDSDDQADEVVKRNDDYELNGLNRGDSPLEKILFNLDGLQSRVLSLKTKLGEVMSENIRDISRSATNLLQEDPHIITYARSLSSPPGNNGDAMPRHHLSEYELEVPKSAVFSYGDAADVDMIECTVDRLLADALLHQHQGRDLYKDIAVADDVLIINQAAKEELQDFEKVRHGEVKLQEAAKEEARSCSEDANTAPTALAAAPGPFGQNGERPVLKSGYTGKKSGRKPKRKRRGGCVSGLKSERIQKR